MLQTPSRLPLQSGRLTLVAGVLAVLVAFGSSTLAPEPARSDDVRAVRVLNFPELQPVELEKPVEVTGTLDHSELFRTGEVVVSPVAPTDYAQLVEGGVIDAGGFTTVSLSLSAEVKGRVERPGEVGAILIPDVEPVLDALRRDGVVLFPLRVTAPVDTRSAWTSSEPTLLPLAFPRYRVLFYNTGDRAVAAHLFAYLGQ